VGASDDDSDTFAGFMGFIADVHMSWPAELKDDFLSIPAAGQKMASRWNLPLCAPCGSCPPSVAPPSSPPKPKAQ
jgi:hypothetical protein